MHDIELFDSKGRHRLVSVIDCLGNWKDEKNALQQQDKRIIELKQKNKTMKKLLKSNNIDLPSQFEDSSSSENSIGNDVPQLLSG